MPSIASELGLSIYTAATYLARVRHKLGQSSRWKLAIHLLGPSPYGMRPGRSSGGRTATPGNAAALNSGTASDPSSARSGYNRRMGETGASFGGRAKFQPGGTPGGGGEFLSGLAMMAIGIYMVFERVTVHTSFWRFFGSAQSSFGVTLLPLLAGVGILAGNGRSILGWLLAAGGVLFILVGVLMNLDIYFQPTSLWATLVMFGLIAAGLGLFAKSLRPHRGSAP